MFKIKKKIKNKKKVRNVKRRRETTETDFFLNSVQIGVGQKLFQIAHRSTVAFVITVT